MSRTPGEWTCSPCRCGHPGCDTFVIDHGLGGFFSREDAALIIAAKHLLAALEELKIVPCSLCNDEVRESGTLVCSLCKGRGEIVTGGVPTRIRKAIERTKTL